MQVRELTRIVVVALAVPVKENDERIPSARTELRRRSEPKRYADVRPVDFSTVDEFREERDQARVGDVSVDGFVPLRIAVGDRVELLLGIRALDLRRNERKRRFRAARFRIFEIYA